jgi:hypothetical protein
MTRTEFGWRLLFAALLTPVFYAIDQVFGGPSGGGAWALAAVAALCLVFLGELLIDAFTGDA